MYIYLWFKTIKIYLKKNKIACSVNEIILEQ